MIIVDLVTDEDRSILSEPKNEVPITGHARIDPQEMRVNGFFSQCELDVAPHLVVTHVGGERGGKTQSGKRDRSVRGVATRLDRLGMIERHLVAVRDHEPPSRLVLNRLYPTFDQSDKDIRRGVADTYDIPRAHATMEPSLLHLA